MGSVQVVVKMVCDNDVIGIGWVKMQKSISLRILASPAAPQQGIGAAIKMTKLTLQVSPLRVD